MSDCQGSAGPPLNGHAALITDQLLERLRGRMSLIQPADERLQLVGQALDALNESRPQGQPPCFTSEQERAEFLKQFLTYDVIDELLTDPTIEDIMINGTQPIFVHRTGAELVKTGLRFPDTRTLELFVKKTLVFAGRQTLDDQIYDVELSDVRGRVNIIRTPFGPQVTITRGKPQPLTILQLIHSGMLSYELAGQIWIYVEGLRVRPASLLIAGTPGAGKTTILNAIFSFIPWHERLVTIEDTLEFNTEFLENCSRLESCRRVKMPDLVKNSLRMRPDRIVVGEVRGAEARDLMTAMNLGKYCMGTIHAQTARETILRLQNEPMNVPPILVSLIDVFIMIRKRNVGGVIKREVCELVEGAGMERDVVLLSTVWKFDPDRREVIETQPSSVYRDKLAAESGRTPAQIMEEVDRRAAILKAMHESGRFPTITDVTRFCQFYSASPAEAVKDLGLKLSVMPAEAPPPQAASKPSRKGLFF